MDTKISPVKASCKKHLQKGVRQQRHLLKKFTLISMLSMMYRKKAPSHRWLTLIGPDLWHIGWSRRAWLVFPEIRFVVLYMSMHIFLISPFMQKICQINILNSSVVQFQQTNGSHRYSSHLENLVSQDMSLAQQNNAMGVCCLELFGYFLLDPCAVCFCFCNIRLYLTISP
jgi:hypothetical protein